MEGFNFTYLGYLVVALIVIGLAAAVIFIVGSVLAVVGSIAAVIAMFVVMGILLYRQRGDSRPRID